MNGLKIILPTDDQLEQIITIYRSKKEKSVIQHPKFPINNKTSVFCLFEENVIVAYAFINESKLSKLPFLKKARLNFGPIGISTLYEERLLILIIEHYIKNKFISLTIYPFSNSNLKNFDFKKYKSFYLSEEKGTLLIDLQKDINEIESSFSTILKKNLKRASKLDLEIRKIESDLEINLFCESYLKMSNFRNVFHYKKDEIRALIEFSNDNEGIVLGCFYEGILIGGLIGLIKGDQMEYYLGFTDPEYKKLPQSHLTLYNAIKIAKELNLRYFDMGGIVLDAKEEDQVFHITNFKFHFSKNIVNYDKPIEFVFGRLKKTLFTIYLKLAR